MSINFLNKLLKLHNIDTKYAEQIYEITDDDYDLNIKISKKYINQEGGALNREFMFDNKKYLFFKTETKDKVQYSIKHQNIEFYNNDKNNESLNCLLIYIPKTNPADASIKNINVYPECYDIKKTQVNGSLLLDIALNFIKFMKDRYNINKITLIDESYKKCKFTNESIHFPILYTFMYGTTWYGRRGFIPYSEDKNINTFLLKKFESNKKLYHELKIKDYPLKEKILIAHKKLSINKKFDKLLIDEIINFINKYPNEKLSVFIKKFIGNEQFCALFQNFYFMLAEDLKIYDFTGKKFIKYI